MARRINHAPIFLETNKTNPRSLHNQSMIFVRSTAQPDSIRVVKPDSRTMRLAKDEIRKNNEHGLVRRVSRDKTNALSIFPIVPKRKMK